MSEPKASEPMSTCIRSRALPAGHPRPVGGVPVSTTLHGGYDQVVEISAAYLIAQAQDRLTVSDVVIDETSATDALKGRIGVSVHKVWLGSRDERYGPAGAWIGSAPSAPASRLIIAIDLATGTSGADRLLVSKIRGIAIPADQQRLDLRAGVVLAIPIVAERLHVRPDAGSPFPDESVPAVALKLGAGGHRGQRRPARSSCPAASTSNGCASHRWSATSSTWPSGSAPTPRCWSSRRCSPSSRRGSTTP